MPHGLTCVFLQPLSLGKQREENAMKEYKTTERSFQTHACPLGTRRSWRKTLQGYEWPLFYVFPQFLLNKSGLSKIRLIKRRQACNSHWREWWRDFSDRLLSVGALLWSLEAVGSDSLRFDSAGWILNHQRQSPFIQIWPLVKTLCCWFIQPNCVVSNKRWIVLCNKCCNRRKTWVVCVRSSISYS